MSNIENEIISSKFIKEIAKLGGDLRKFATKSVIKSIKLKFR
jgi:pantetheine-phosphate adenylyltransferase